MVIGNGFFSDNREAALMEMQERSQCEVRHLPYPTVGNITYYIGYTGDLYGQQMIQGRPLTRQRKHQKYSIGYTARLCSSPHKEAHFHLQVLTWSAFVLNRWEPNVDLEFKNGNCYDVRPSNLQERKPVIPTEWAETMTRRQDIYASNFLHVAWSVNYVTGLGIEDCKDVAQSAFIYLCTDGYHSNQEQTDIVGLWVKIARLRGIDYMRRRWIADSDMVERQGLNDKPYETDLFHLQPGKRRQTYLRMWAEGNTPTEIAKECGATRGTVSCSISRSIQFLQRYFKHEMNI